jgi:N-acetyl-gamma-glutamyl-phosphate reductase
MTKPCKIFIDGEAGTTGLGIRERLENEADFQVLSIDPQKRKDPHARLELMKHADIVVLCLPDDAAKESVALCASLADQAPKILDASTAYRTAPDWTYGFAEMDVSQSVYIATASKVSNPGCYPTGAIALLKPLISQGLIPADFPITINAVSGYSGGGKAMIEAYEAGTAPAFELYGLGLEHKHVPEIQIYSGLTRRPLFVPSVGNFKQGMLVSIPLHLDALPAKAKADDFIAALQKHFVGSAYVSVLTEQAAKLEPEALNDTNMMELRVFANEAHRHMVLVARLDNLGKGASGAAMQNLKLMRGGI